MISNRNKVLLNYVLTQYSINRGIKKFKDRPRNAVKAEFYQLHEFEYLEFMHRHHLTDTQLKDTLESLSFMKGKERIE